MSEDIQIVGQAEESPIILRAKKMDLEAGWIGRLFGSGANAPMNIAGILVILLAVSGIAILFIKAEIPAADYWKIIVPLLTLVMGYVFGKSSST